MKTLLAAEINSNLEICAVCDNVGDENSIYSVQSLYVVGGEAKIILLEWFLPVC